MNGFNEMLPFYLGFALLMGITYFSFKKASEDRKNYDEFILKNKQKLSPKKYKKFLLKEIKNIREMERLVDGISQKYVKSTIGQDHLDNKVKLEQELAELDKSYNNSL